MILKILLIDNYDSFTYNIVELLRQVKNSEFIIVKNDELNAINVNDFTHVILSPGPNIPSASGDLMNFIKEHFSSIPIFGICLGHQAIAEFFGGQLKNFEAPFHGEKTIITQEKPSVLFKDLPQSFEVGLYHSWYVSNELLPKEIEGIALSQDGVIMALQHKELPLYGVQFHPESFMSEYGINIIENFLAI